MPDTPLIQSGLGGDHGGEGNQGKFRCRREEQGRLARDHFDFVIFKHGADQLTIASLGRRDAKDRQAPAFGDQLEPARPCFAILEQGVILVRRADEMREGRNGWKVEGMYFGTLRCLDLEPVVSCLLSKGFCHEWSEREQGQQDLSNHTGPSTLNIEHVSPYSGLEGEIGRSILHLAVRYALAYR